MISESERPLQKEIPRPGKGSKDGKEKTRKTLKTLLRKQKRLRSARLKDAVYHAERHSLASAYISGNRLFKDKKGRALFCVEDNLDDGKTISTVSSADQNLKTQPQSVQPHNTTTKTLIRRQFKKSIKPSAR